MRRSSTSSRGRWRSSWRLALSLFNLPNDVQKRGAAAGGVAAICWSISYFTFFWSTTGQTPGNRVMSIEVRGVKGERLSVRRAFVRVLLLPLVGPHARRRPCPDPRRPAPPRAARHLVAPRSVYVAKVPRARAGARPARPVYVPPDAQAASTSPPPSSATRRPKRISAG